MRFSLKQRLIGLFVLMGLLPFLFIGIYAYFSASAALKEGAENQLKSVRDLKKGWIEEFLGDRLGSAEFYNENTAVQEAFERFVNAFESGGIKGEEWKRWDAFHGAKISKFIETNHFYDGLMISKDGDVVFTHTKESDLGKNVITDLKDTPLNKAFNKGLKEFHFTDMAWYAPSNDVACFISGPLKNTDGQLLGVFAYQISLQSINKIMQERSGMSDTGETYLVGSDKLMRSDSYLDQENHTVKASFENKKKIDTESVNEGLNGKSGIHIVDDYRGIRVLSAYAAIDFMDTRWVILAEVDEDEAFEEVNSLRNTIVVFGLIIFAVIIIIGWFFGNSISNPLNEVTSAISSSSSEIAATVNQHEKTAAAQSSSVNETTTTMDELGVSSQRSAEQAQSASNSAQNALESSQRGSVAVKQSLEGMLGLKEKIGAVADQILRLSEQTSQIGTITKLVKDIADQTNLLALNAAVEAARAGEHGKGFAVVAVEIRKLAEESKKSADRINALVDDIQKATNSTVMVTEEGTKTVEQEMKLAQKAAQAFDDTSGMINDVYQNVQQIVLNVRQQADALQQVVDAMNSINAGSRETASGLNQTKVGINQLNDAAQKLKAMM